MSISYGPLAEVEAQSGALAHWLQTNWLTSLVVVLLVVAIILLSKLLLKPRGPQNSSAVSLTDSDAATRSALARNVLIFSICGVILLAMAVLFSSSPANAQSAQYVFGAVLPLLGTWVGTVMAYYFSRENLAAATQSVSTLANQMKSGDDLDSIRVVDRMRKLADIKAQEVAVGQEGAKRISDLLADKVERVVVVTPAKQVRFLIYRAVLNEFLAPFSRPNPPALPQGRATVADLTLADLIVDPDRKKLFESSWATVSQNQSMGDARRAMKRQGEKCNDVFVTTDGSRESALLGWITDNKLEESAKS